MGKLYYKIRSLIYSQIMLLLLFKSELNFLLQINKYIKIYALCSGVSDNHILEVLKRRGFHVFTLVTQSSLAMFCLLSSYLL